MRVLGVLIMLFIALIDASLNVQARAMRHIHYSLIQFWFAAISLVVLLVYYVVSSAVNQELPTLFHYSSTQMLHVGLTGIFSAINLTSLTISF